MSNLLFYALNVMRLSLMESKLLLYINKLIKLSRLGSDDVGGLPE